MRRKLPSLWNIFVYVVLVITLAEAVFAFKRGGVMVGLMLLAGVPLGLASLRMAVVELGWEKLLTVLFKLVFIYVSLAGQVGFTMFIMEESLQTVTFATWEMPEGDRQLHAEVYRWILDRAEWFTAAFGWLNPLAKLSFECYWKAAEVYWISAYRDVLEPEMLQGGVP